MHLLAQLSGPSAIVIVLAVGLALAFEFVNGFHDTANAVATVIYTNSLRPWVAVVWSGLWNLIGVLASNGGVAATIILLLPSDVVANVGSVTAFTLIFSLLISAIIWNVGTWFLGLPASSSHTLIGAIMGVGLAHSLATTGSLFGHGLDWSAVAVAFSALLISPVVGFLGAGILLLISKLLIRMPELYKPPVNGAPPPTWIRALLVFTCTGVSFAHGSNDGQKGMGLMMLILIGLLPGTYALTPGKDFSLPQLHASAVAIQPLLDARVPSETPVDHGAHVVGPPMTDDVAAGKLSAWLNDGAKPDSTVFAALAAINRQLATMLDSRPNLDNMPELQGRIIRRNSYLIAKVVPRLVTGAELADPSKELSIYATALNNATLGIPNWVKVATAFSLGLGTMVGWKRIVKTVGEKIGKQHMTYAQGAAAGLTAMLTIGGASDLHMPVSTTHVLTSGVAGTMAANRSGLQIDTIRNVLLAWVLTLPVCVLLGAATFSAGLYFVIDVLHKQ